MIEMIIKFNENNWRQNKILYITGVSCSGKTDLAKDLAKEFSADIIHLDTYFNYPQTIGMMCEKFNRYLLECCPEYFDILPDFKEYCGYRYFLENPFGIRYWKIMDKLVKCIKGFVGTNDRFVIVEGNQIFDGTIKDIKDLIHGESLFIIKDKLSACARRRQQYSTNETETMDTIKRQLVRESQTLNQFIEQLYDTETHIIA